MRIRAKTSNWYNGIEFVLQDGRAFSKEVIFEELPEGFEILPTGKMSHQEATELMDELWSCGIRPTQEGTAGQLKATERHLSDMRKLVFKE